MYRTQDIPQIVVFELLKEAGVVSYELWGGDGQEKWQVGKVNDCWGSLCLWL